MVMSCKTRIWSGCTETDRERQGKKQQLTGYFRVQKRPMEAGGMERKEATPSETKMRMVNGPGYYWAYNIKPVGLFNLVGLNISPKLGMQKKNERTELTRSKTRFRANRFSQVIFFFC